jgi:hypothetical protein
MKNLKVDIGLDELDDDSYSIALMDESGIVIATVYGKTPEEAIKRAESLFCKEEIITILKNFNDTIISSVLKNDERSVITTSTLKSWIKENVR